MSHREFKGADEPDDTPKQVSTIAGTILLAVVCTTIFVVPLFPESWHWLMYNLLYTVIYLAAANAVVQYQKGILALAVSAIIIEWTADLVDLGLVTAAASAINVAFFIVVVVALIAGIAKTQRVTVRLIVKSINAYLLLGLAFAVLVTLIATHQPNAYSATDAGAVLGETADRPSDYTYYAFVTFTTLGYGDMLPTTPLTKSLALLMSISGQLYVAVILAMLVGKFSSSQDHGEGA